ncbi:MAG: DUF6106 family protein [Eubacteriales bacterium]
MNESLTYEKVVSHKADAALTFKRIILIALYVFVTAAWVFFGIMTEIYVPLIFLIPITLWALIFLTWKYVNIEYEYSMTAGVLTFSEIFGKCKRKTLFETEIKKMLIIAPYNDEYLKRAESLKPQTEYLALSSRRAENQYFAVFEDEDEKRAIFIFEADERALRIFRFYNPSAMNIR